MNRIPPRGVVAALWVLAVAAQLAHLATQFSAPLLPGDPWQLARPLLDYRDTVWVPGNHLLSGANPYDTDAQLAAYPWAQGLRLYAPAWLLLAVPLGALPYLLGGLVYQLFGVAAVLVLIRVVVRLTMPGFVAVATPAALIGLTVVAPGRYALENLSSALVALGVVLVLRGIWLGGIWPARDRRPATALTATGVALSLIKPQFGLIVLVVALAGRRLDAVWRGVLALAAASLPVVVACVVASGGFGGFLAAVRGNLDYSTSPEATTGLLSERNVRIDVVGQLGRLGYESPGWLQLAVLVVTTAIAAWLAARSRSLLVLTAGVAAAMLLGFVHEPYDMILLFLPLCAGLGAVLDRQPLAGLERAAWVCVGLASVHVHRVSTTLVPGLTGTGADRIDTALLLVALLLCTAAGVVHQDRRYSSAERGLGVAPSRVQRAEEM